MGPAFSSWQCRPVLSHFQRHVVATLTISVAVTALDASHTISPVRKVLLVSVQLGPLTITLSDAHWQGLAAQDLGHQPPHGRPGQPQPRRRGRQHQRRRLSRLSEHHRQQQQGHRGLQAQAADPSSDLDAEPWPVRGAPVPVIGAGKQRWWAEAVLCGTARWVQ